MSEDNNKENEANFNDAELQDIMAEIENLEQEFSEEEESLEEEVVAKVEEAPAQIEEEEVVASEPVAEESAPIEPVEQVDAVTVDHEEAVLSFDHKSAPSQDAGEMSFQGQGTLNFSMNFQVGSEEAVVSVASGQINVKMGDIDLVISEQGCFVEMAGGVNFSVPLNDQSHKKEAA